MALLSLIVAVAAVCVAVAALVVTVRSYHRRTGKWW